MTNNYELAVSNFRGGTLRLTALVVGGVVWTALLWGRTYADEVAMPAMSLAIAAMLICGIITWLHARHYRTAVFVLIAGFWLCNTAAVYHLDESLFLTMFALVVVLAYSLSNMTVSVVVGVISSLFILLHTGSSLVAVNTEAARPLIVIWSSWLVALVAFNSLHRALEIAWRYQNYAVQQMDEARDARAELAHMAQALQVAQRNLASANVQLKQTLHLAERARYLKAQFAANVSHELRTPINLIVGFSEMIMLAPEAYGADLPLVYRADMNAIYRNAKHLQNLINDILDISRIEAGRMTVIKEEIDSCEVIQAVAAMARDMIQRKGLVFDVQLDDDLPVLWLDRTRIMQALLNLLANATRFTEQGSITLRARVDEKFLKISVSDTGIGIAPDKLEHIFEEFYQVEDVLRSELNGTGLGLSLSRQFVRLHGGYMLADSAGIPGQGSEFTVALPLSEEIAESRLPEHLEPRSVEGAQCLVIMDKDPTIRQLFKGYIGKHHVLETLDSAEMLQLVEQIKPAAVVLEHTPENEAFISYITESSPNTTIVLCPMPRGKRAAHIYGAQDYLVKPIARTTLLETLQRLPLPVKNILIVDDNPDMNSMFTRMLQSSPVKYRVTQAFTGEDGLTAMRSQRPDVVLLDIVMPDIDGFTVLQRVKSDPVLAGIPVILVSARGAVEDETPDARGVIAVYKPAGFKPIELVNCVDAVVSELMIANAPAS